jgi:hypothetical protein
MSGHHLIMGELEDFITGEILEDTHDERYRQKIARFLVLEKGYAKTDIHPRQPLIVAAGSRKGRLVVDFIVVVDDWSAMVIKYGPGSLVTRYRPSLAISRVLVPYQIPLVLVTNGESVDILDGHTGKLQNSGFERIPSRDQLARQVMRIGKSPVASYRKEMESRIVYAFEIDGGCPCDDSTCRIA